MQRRTLLASAAAAIATPLVGTGHGRAATNQAVGRTAGEQSPTMTLTRCFFTHRASGELVLWVVGLGMLPDDTIVLLDGRPCRRYYYPTRFIDPGGIISQIGCSEMLRGRLPAAVTTLTVSTLWRSDNSIFVDESLIP